MNDGVIKLSAHAKFVQNRIEYQARSAEKAIEKASSAAVDAFNEALREHASNLVPADRVRVAAIASWVIQTSYLEEENKAVSAVFGSTLDTLSEGDN